MLCRFNIITEDKPDPNEIFQSVKWTRLNATHGTADFKTERSCSLRKLCNSDPDSNPDDEPKLRKTLDDLILKYKDTRVLVEVILRPSGGGLFGMARTLGTSQTTQNEIGGRWLRGAFKLTEIRNNLWEENAKKPPAPKLKNTKKEKNKETQKILVQLKGTMSDMHQALNIFSQDGVNQTIDDSNTIEQEKNEPVRKWNPNGATTSNEIPIWGHVDHLPRKIDKKKADKYPFTPAYEVIGLNDNMRTLPFADPPSLKEDGLWSSTVLGCAASDYVRDFAHFILQYKLPQPIKPVSVAILFSLNNLTSRTEEEKSR